MKELIELANKIKDKKLRDKTIELIKEPEISNKEIIYPKADLKKVPSWIGTHHSYEGGLAKHTASVTKLCLSMVDDFEKEYKTKVNKDHLIAGALLHDIMRVFMLKKVGKQWDLTGSLLDHAVFTACELYARDFPEQVVHIVAAHGGDAGAASAHPRTIEALILYHADIADASVDAQINAVPSPLQFLLMEE